MEFDRAHWKFSFLSVQMWTQSIKFVLQTIDAHGDVIECTMYFKNGLQENEQQEIEREKKAKKK